jgi:hypothetical protein
VSVTWEHRSWLPPASLARQSSAPCAVRRRGSRRVKKTKVEDLSEKVSDTENSSQDS